MRPAATVGATTHATAEARPGAARGASHGAAATCRAAARRFNPWVVMLVLSLGMFMTLLGLTSGGSRSRVHCTAIDS